MFLKNILLTKALELLLETVVSDESIDKARNAIREKVIEIVGDDSNPWDNRAANILLKLLGIDPI